MTEQNDKIPKPSAPRNLAIYMVYTKKLKCNRLLGHQITHLCSLQFFEWYSFYLSMNWCSLTYGKGHYIGLI